MAFLEELANSRRGVMKGRIEKVITEALHLIYDSTYRTELSYSVKNNRSNLIIEMVRETPAGDVRRQMGGFGGGVADTMSVPMRLMVLMGANQTDKVCVLDECWKHMDVERIPLIGNFIRLLTDRLGIQVVFCTHHHPLRAYADKTYEISEEDGVSAVQVFS
jgi:Fe-S cluster assembly ATPase SufC